VLIFDQLKKNDPQLRAIALIVLCGLGLLAVGLWWVQVVSVRDFQAHLEMQSYRTVRMPAVRWRYATGPTFENSIGIVELDGRRAEVTIYRAEPGDPADALQPLHAHLLADGPRAG